MKPHRLTMDSEMLGNFKESMNGALAMILNQLEEKNLSEGAISAKIKIKLMKKTDEDGALNNFIVLEPDISLKIGAKGKIECNTESAIMQIDDEGIPIVASSQISIDELLQEEKGA